MKGLNRCKLLRETWLCGDDTSHAIVHIGNILFTMYDGKVKYLAHVLHVPSITKNLVSMGQRLSKDCMSNLHLQDSLLKSSKKMIVLLLEDKNLA